MHSLHHTSLTSAAKYFDIIIVGAGPAGSTCALALADSGLRVALMDKSTFPRDKVCGDAIASYVPKVLASINPSFEKQIDTFEERYVVDTYRIVAPGGKRVDVKLTKSGFISKRMDFDNFLLELTASQRNISYFLGYNVTDVSIDERSAEATVTANGEVFKAKIVIGCDGAQTLVGKKTRELKHDLSHHSAAVRAYYKNVGGMSNGTFELHFINEILPGYFWIFPLNDNIVNVGIGAVSSSISKGKINLRESLKHVITSIPSISERFENAEMIGTIKGFGLPLGSRKVTMSGDHFMLCGDAASLIDPMTGEGIGQAMVSGRYAGWHAIRCFERNDFSSAFMVEYDQQVHAKFWKKHRRNYLMQKYLMNRPALIKGVVSAASRSKAIRDFLTDHLM